MHKVSSPVELESKFDQQHSYSKDTNLKNLKSSENKIMPQATQSLNFKMIYNDNTTTDPYFFKLNSGSFIEFLVDHALEPRP